MVKINSIETYNLRNDEHFQFFNDFNSAVQTITPVELAVVEIYPEFQSAFETEDETMLIELGSSKSAELKTLDKLRDQTWNSINKGAYACTICPIEAEKQAGLAIKRVIDLYGDNRAASYVAETGSITNLTNDLLSAINRPHLVTINKLSWVEALQTQNNSFRALLNARNDELSIRESGDVRAIRVLVDAAYQKLVTRINATIELSLAKPAVEPFVKSLNERISYYNNLLTLRHSRIDPPTS